MSRRRNAQPLAGQRRRDLVTRSGGGGGGGTETRSWGGPSAVPLADARTPFTHAATQLQQLLHLPLNQRRRCSLEPPPSLLRPQSSTSPLCRRHVLFVYPDIPLMPRQFAACALPFHLEASLFFISCCSLDPRLSKSFAAISYMTVTPAPLRSLRLFSLPGRRR